MMLVRSLVLSASVATSLCLASVPASAAEIPSACVNPTAEEKADATLQAFCKDIIEMDAALGAIRAALDSFKKLGETTDQLLKEIEKMSRELPPERPRAQDHLPSRPGQTY